MKIRENKLYHLLSGNDAKPEATGLTRGVVAAAILEILGLVVELSPASAETATTIVTHAGSVSAILSFVIYGYLDRWLKNRGFKD